mgnify:CR=1 FL=1
MTKTLYVRSAEDSDGPIAVPLLLTAGEELLVAIFGQGNTSTALNFLHDAWHQRTGQYGYQQHWVAVQDNEVVGLVTCWHSELGVQFDRDTLQSITRFYGSEQALKIIHRSQELTAELSAPVAHELNLGHLAVHSDYQRQGIGRLLIEFIVQQAKSLSKQTLTLDVELQNIEALQFYIALGFTEQHSTSRFVQLQKTVGF